MVKDIRYNDCLFTFSMAELAEAAVLRKNCDF